MLRSERQRLIASNIANADTPGYVARDFSFAQALRQATGSSGGGGAGGGGDTRLGGPITGDLLAEGFGRSRAAPTLRYAAASQTNLDSNTVDMDRERASFADNALKYESTLRFINGSVRTMLDAMKSHNQG
jgi:flagellar basal-body rod protein FlgB